MTPRAQDSTGKSCFTGVHNRQTNLTPRHVTTTPNMSARSAMDQKELEDRLAAAEALSSLGSIASVASAFKDSALMAQVSSASNMAPQNDKPRKGEARGRGGGRKKDEKGTGRETKSRSTRGRGRARVVQAGRTSTTSAVTLPTVPPHVDGLPDQAVPHAAVAAASKPASRGRGRPRGRGGKRGSKTTQPVGQDGVVFAPETLGRGDSTPHLPQSSPALLPWTVSEKTGVHAFVREMSGHVSLQQPSATAATLGRSVPGAAFVPSLAGYVGVNTNTVSLSAISSSATSSHLITSPRTALSCSSPHTTSRPTPVTSLPTSTAMTTVPAVSLPSQPNLASLRLDSLPSLSLGSIVLPNLPSIPNLPSLPSAIASLQLAGVRSPGEMPAAPEDGAASQLSPQSRDSGEKSLPLKKRKVIDSSPPPSSSVLSSSVPKASSVSPVSPSMMSPADVKTHVEPVPSTSGSAPEKPSDEGAAVESPGPVLPMNLLGQVLPPPMYQQLLSEIETAITPDEDGDVPLHIAVVHENEAMVKKLIQLMALAGQKVDRYNKQHQTPLHLAVKLASLSAIQMLLEAGADPNLVDSGGLTSTHMAVQGRDIDCLEALLQWGKFPCDLNYRNFEGLAPLHTAVMNNDLEIVVRLLDQGADINIMDGKSGRTVLFHAAETNQRAAVELLLGRGADPEIANYAGVVPALAAQGRNHTTVARLLARALEEGAEVVEKGAGAVVEEGMKEGQRGGESRHHSPGGLEIPVTEVKRGSPHSSQEQGLRLSTSIAAHIKQHVAKTAGQGQQPTVVPPSILQSSSVPSSLPRPQLVKGGGSPASGKPADGSPAARPVPGSVLRATHQMPGVVSRTSKGLSGSAAARPAAMVRRNSVPVRTDAPVTPMTLSKSSTPPLHLGSAPLPLGLLHAAGDNGGPGRSGPSVPGVKREVVSEEFDRLEGQRSGPPPPPSPAGAMTQDDLRKILIQNLMKLVEQKQNGGQGRVVNWPTLPPGGIPLSLPVSLAAEAGGHPQPAASGASPLTPVRAVSRVVPLPVPTTSVVTSPAVSERGLVSSLSGSATPSAAHSQPTRPLLVVRSSSVDPVSADGRRMGSVELRHVTTDALLALQHSSTNSVNLANQNFTSSPIPFQQQPPSFLASRPAAGFAVAMETDKVPPVSNHVARKTLQSQVLTYASDGYSDEPKDLSLKSKKRASPESMSAGSVKTVKPEPVLSPAERPKATVSSKGGSARKRQSETPVQEQSKPTPRKVPKAKSSETALRRNEKIAAEDKPSVSVTRTTLGSTSTERKKADNFSHSPEGAVISISESGILTSEMRLDSSAPVVEINKTLVKVTYDTDSPTTSTHPAVTRRPDVPDVSSDQLHRKPPSSSQRLKVPDPRKKTAKGDSRAAKSSPSSSAAKQQTDMVERKNGKGTDRSPGERGDQPQCSNKDGTALTLVDLQAKDQSLATG